VYVALVLYFGVGNVRGMVIEMSRVRNGEQVFPRPFVVAAAVMWEYQL
jgi:hypothetical protein